MSSLKRNSIHPHLNIPFWNGDCASLLHRLKTAGGLLIVPSGPNLTDCRHDTVYKKALRSADFAVMDSGFLALILRAKGVKPTEISRISGFQILEVFLDHPNGKKNSVLNNDKTLWVVPSSAEEIRIQNYLKSKNFDLQHHHFYLAPFYKNGQSKTIEDDLLLKFIQKENPNWVILCVAGGKQEKLGLFLRDALRNKSSQKPKVKNQTSPGENQNRPGGVENDAGIPEPSDLQSAHHPKFQIPAILCTGAAIAFLTGGQATIPKWVDRLYLGWLARTLQSPRKYFYRYFQASRLPFILRAWKE